jgi:molecular chaperone GrpE
MDENGENKKNEKKEVELDVAELKEKIKDCEKQKAEYLAGWQRARADLLNYKKEETERVADILKYANEGLILKMLPILDNFDVALKNIPDEGFLQIRKQFQNFLKEQGVEEIESLGKKFDPNLHEVVEEIEINKEEQVTRNKEQGTRDNEQGTILEEIQKGYTINGRLLRPAKVKVFK